MNILIIGGGAAGMAAALTASEAAENNVLLVERQARMGRKLLSTGNGRCNLTNRVLSPENYHGQQAEFCRTALTLFPPEETIEWFASMGLLTVTEAGLSVFRQRQQRGGCPAAASGAAGERYRRDCLRD